MQLLLIKAREHQNLQLFSFDRFSISFIALVPIALGIFLPMLNPAHAQELVGFYTNLSGMEEVPPTNTTASGLAVLLYNNESSQLSYLVNVTGLDKISESGIHNGSRGINGDVVIPLKGNETADKKESDYILFQDDMKENDLQGPLKGQEITDLVQLMSNESAYVNILTDKNPSGEIRGQLQMGQIQLDPAGGITGLMIPGGILQLTGVVLRDGVIVFSDTGTIGYIPAPNGGSSPADTGDVVGGVTSVVGELGGIVGKIGATLNEVTNIVEGTDSGSLISVDDNNIGNNNGNINTGDTLSDNTVQNTAESTEQASSAVIETIGDSGNTLENTVQKIDDEVVSKLLNDDEEDDDEKDSDGGDSKDSNDEKDSDGGDSVKDTVKKLLS